MIWQLRIKVLLMLTVFTANLYAVCHCQHMVKTRTVMTGCSRCHTHDRAGDPAPCSGKDGCTGSQAVKFSLLEKQTAERIAPAPPFMLHLAFFSAMTVQPVTRPGRTSYNDGSPKYAPPNFQTLYQCYRI